MVKHFKDVKGVVVAVRLPENVYILLRAKVQKSGLTLSGYVRSIIMREVSISSRKR